MKRGWCPSVFEPMPSGDGMVARIKPRAGPLTVAQTRRLAEAATRCGNGVIEATMRANLQIRGLSSATIAPFAAAMVEVGLADHDPAVERRRNIIAGLGPTAHPHTGAVTEALQHMLAARSHLAALPAKFGFLVDGGGLLSPAGAPADIWVRLADDACTIGVDSGRDCIPASFADAPSVALALADRFLATGNATRMRAVVETIGTAPLFAGFGTVPASAPLRKQATIGWHGSDHLGLGLPFGSIAANDLAALADFAELWADSLLHVTPGRTVVLTGMRARALPDLPFITDPADPRLAIAACPGMPACASGTVETRWLASALAELRLPGTVHISGCAKGCAHPGPAAVTLVGNDGLYDLVRGGAASDPPTRRRLTAREAIAAL